MADEALLIAKAKKGDLDAFGQMLSSVETRLFRVALLLCGERESAKDLLQETFFSLYQSLPRFLGRCSFYTYSYRVLLNLYHKRNRRKKYHLISLSDLLRQPHSPSSPFKKGGFPTIKVGGYRGISPKAPSPAEEFVLTEKQEKVRLAITKMPFLFQEIISLRYLEELSIAEIARRLRINEGTVKSRLFKAKWLLADILKNEPL
ncbi:MAG: RNA polymerase sigma factor [Candidatus Omnitrophota bacterium]